MSRATIYSRKLIHALRLLVVGLILVTSAGPLVAQCLEGDCQNGEGLFLFPDGRRYTGAFKQGQPQGEGTLLHPNGERYTGRFYLGQAHGQGIHYFADGSKRQGTWRNGQIESADDQLVQVAPKRPTTIGCVNGNCYSGKGTYITPGGTVYVGQFQDGEIYGNGVCTYTDGSRYEGEWVHRYPQGFGHKTWADGRQYSGQWHAGRPVDGNGVYQYPNQPLSVSEAGLVIQSGCLQGDCENGSGTFAYADGSRYEGQFLAGKPHGQGSFYYPNGDRYTGAFSYGLPHGDGVRYYAAGERREGQWDQGVYLETLNFNNGSGCMKGDCNSGFGTYRFPVGDSYEGTFEQGKPNGYGEVTYQNGDRYIGGMADGAFAGYGTFYQASGGVFQGRWQAGEYMGNTRSNTQQTESDANPSIKVWALIVGVSSYEHMPALRFPDDDAYRLFAFLKSPPGGAIPDDRIRILVDEDATRQNIVQGMQDLFLKAGPQDLIILYFSGHGLPGAFLPIDYNGDDHVLAHSDIKRWLDRSPAGYKLCLADACHSGGLVAAKGASLPQVLRRYYDNLSATRPGTALIMSSKANETSLESSGLRQGVFSHFLLRGLKGEADHDADGVVRIVELFNYIKGNTEAYTQRRQSPILEGDYDRKMPIAVVR